MNMINCYTCCEQRLRSVKVIDTCYRSQTVKMAIIQLVPELAGTISNNDYVCMMCFKSLLFCLKFIERCRKAQMNLSESMSTSAVDQEAHTNSEALEVSIESNKKPSKTSSTMSQKQQIVIKTNTPAELPTTKIITRDHDYPKIQLDFAGAIETLKDALTYKEKVVSIRQPGGLITPEFLTALKENNVKIIQHSPIDNNTSKRILLLGRKDDTYTKKTNCPRCKRLVLRTSLMPHLKLCVTTPCVYCNEPVGKGLMKKHIAEVHKLEQPFNCQKCGKKFLSSPRLKLHILGCEVERCPHCDILVTRRELRMHTAAVHGDNEPFKCSRCGKTFRDHTRYKMHMDTYKGFPCDACKKVLKTQSGYYVHKEKCKGVTMKKCTTCDEEFDSRSAFVLHRARKHRECVCEVCGKRFTNTGLLALHKTTHNPDHTVICHTCGKGFKSPSTLRQHLLTHRTARKLTCDRCPRTFHFRHKLLNHVKSMHDKVRDIPCPDCGMMFSTRCKMRLHYRTVHLRLKPHKCDLCGQMFARLGHLKLHLRTHAREKYKSSMKNDKCENEKNFDSV